MARRKADVAKQMLPEQIMEQIQAGLKQQATKPNLYAYKPHQKQYNFHSSNKHTRLYIGGNRSGKTTGGVAEDCYWLMKRHPYRKLPLPEGPVRGRAVAVDFNYGVAQILLPEFARWLPPSFLINGSWEDSYNREFRILTLANKSFIEFKSYDQDLEKFAGTSRHFTHYDEEPPHHIYNECQARLVDTDGFCWLTMTPVEGMSWVFDDLYLPGTEGDDDIDVIEVDMAENPYISEKAAERYLKTLSPDERKAREHGHFVQLGGRVFKEFNKEVHVVPAFIPPKDWEWYASVDHGYNNPTAWLWHAVSPKGNVVTFSEHYKSEMTVEQHAVVYHARCAGFDRYPDFLVGDPALAQRNGVTGTNIFQEYAESGIYIAPGNNDVASGINRMNEYIRIDAVTKKPTWTITDNCVNLIHEMSRLRWKTWSNRKAEYQNNKHEQIHKKDDHACDSTRYFFTLMPDLKPEPIDDKQRLSDNILGATTGAPVAGKWDELAKVSSPKETSNDSHTQWSVYSGSDMYAMEY